MSVVNEAAVLNPSEFVPWLAELDLDSIGLAVRAEGVDWGEATIQGQMVRQSQGESSSAGHRPGVPIRIPIRVKEEGEVPLAVAAHKLDAVVARWQEEGGWIRRDYDDAGGFAGSLGYRIIRHTASLAGLQGWLFAHSRDAPDVVLTATRWPIGYRPDKAESEWFDLTDREVLWEIEDMGGTAPGLIYIRYENENETEHLNGLITAIESRDHPQDASADTTARLSYDAAELTLRGGSEVVELGSEQVVEHDGLTAGWLTVLSSKIDGVGHMTHAGVRRPWIRCMDRGTEPGEVEWRMRYRPLGAARWSSDPEVLRIPSRVVDQWDEVDMGEVRSQKAALGDERLEVEIQARAPGGSGAMRIHKLRMYPTEQFALVSTPAAVPAADLQSAKAPGTAENVELLGPIGASGWNEPSKAKAFDGSWANRSLGPGENSYWLRARNFGYTFNEGDTIAVLGARVKVRASGAGVYTYKAAFVIGGVTVELDPGFDAWPDFGSKELLFVLNAEDSPMPFAVADLNSSAFAFQIAAHVPGAAGRTAEVDGIGAVAYYTEGKDENRVCFAQRSLEARTNGIHRQHLTEDVWGRLVEEGMLPYAPPAGLEQRTARGIIVPSQGDFRTVGDVGDNVGRVQVLHQPGYLFAREAAV